MRNRVDCNGRRRSGAMREISARRLGRMPVLFLSLALIGWGLESNLWAQTPRAVSRLEAKIV